MSFENVSYCAAFPDSCWFVKYDTGFYVKVSTMSTVVAAGLLG